MKLRAILIFLGLHFSMIRFLYECVRANIESSKNAGLEIPTAVLFKESLSATALKTAPL